MVYWLLIMISSQWRGWGYGPPKLFGVVCYANLLLLYDCGHLYTYGVGIVLGLSYGSLASIPPNHHTRHLLVHGMN